MPPQIFDFRYIFHDVGGHQLSFEASNQDTTDADYQYFGFVSSFGSWLVLRFHIIVSAIKYEYAAGKTRADYDALWNDATHKYEGTLTFTTFDQLHNL